MKSFVSFVVAAVVLPGVASALTGDIALDLLSALESPIPIAPAATTTATTQITTATQTSTFVSTTTALTSVPLPILFSIDGKVPVTAQEQTVLDELKAMVAKLTAQLAALMAAKSETVEVEESEPAETGVFVRVLDIGSKGADVTKLQEILIARELFFQKATGYFGAITKEALRTLQAEHELEPTGTTVRETRDLLNELVHDPKKGMTTYAIPVIADPIPVMVIGTSTFATSTEETATTTPASTQSSIDTIPPTPPLTVGAGPASASQMSIAWSASTDNVGVVAYTVSRGTLPIATTTMRSYLDVGLPAATTFQYYIRAVDAAGNVSQPSSAAEATTLQ